MKGFAVPPLVCLLACLLVPSPVAAQSQTDQPSIDYGEFGGTSVFRVKLKREALGDANPWTMRARSSDGKTFSVCFVSSPESFARPVGGLSPEDEKKWNAWQEQATALYKKQEEAQKAVNETQAKLDALKTISADPQTTPQVRSEMKRRVPVLQKQLETQNKTLADVQAEVTKHQQSQPTVDWGNRSTEEPLPAEIEILGRFREVAPSEIALVSVPGHGGQSKTLTTIRLAPPQKLPPNPELVKKWAQAWTVQLGAEMFAGGDVRFHYFELRRTAEKYGVEVPQFADRLAELQMSDANSRRPDQVDWFSVTTGASAIRESLQTDRILQVSAVSTNTNVPVASLEGPRIKSHPFDDMLKGRTPVTFDMAKIVPHDQFYVHFSTIKSEIELSDLLDQWGTSLLQSVEVTSRDRRVKQRILNQLTLELSALTRLFGDLVIGDLALTGSDPYLTDGNDVTVIFNVKNALLFDQASALRRAELLKTRPDAENGTLTHDGVEIQFSRTADREISSYRATVGSHKIFSNSLPALKRVLDTAAGKGASLHSAADFRYMRTIFPGTPADEDGFIYLSDAFIRRVVGPEQKIGRLRQLVCLSHVKEIEHAHLHHAVETGKAAPVKLVDLLETKDLKPADVVCPNGGKYTLDESGQATCSVHGSFRLVTPLAEIPIKEASLTEAEGYRAFVTNYNQYWSRFFDPVGIRFRLKDKIEVETCILPLIENSIYNSVREAVGGDPVDMKPLRTSSTIAAAGFKLNLPGPEGQKAVRGMLRDLTGTENRELAESLGSAVTLNFCDAAPLFTVGGRALGLLFGPMSLPRGDDFVIATLLSSITLPVYLTVDLKDPERARKGFDQAVDAALRRANLQFDRFVSLDAYSLNEYRGVPIRTIRLSLAGIQFRFHCLFLSDKFVMATQRYVATDLIDAHAKNPTATTATIPANMRFELHPRAFDRMRPAAATHWQEQMRVACHENLLGNRILLDWANVGADRLAAESLKRFGYVPACPSGGAYRFDKTSGIVSCSIHGASGDPRQPVEATGDEPFVKFIESIQNVNVNFAFTPEGIHTKLEIDRKTQGR